MTAKKRNAADVTMRNIRATRATVSRLAKRVATLERIVVELERAAIRSVGEACK